MSQQKYRLHCYGFVVQQTVKFCNKSAARSWVTKLGWGRKLENFSTDRCKFPAEEIRGVQHFNFAPKLRKMGDFQPQIE